MRRLQLLLAPLLLTGCAFLYPTSMTSSTTQDGYELTCVDMELSACISLADHGAMLFRMDSTEPITSITIGADGNGTICSASGCAELRTD